MNSLLVDAARWRLLGLLFERPRVGWHAEVRALATEVNEPRFEQAAQAAADAGEGSYLAALGPGAAVSPREVAYRPMGDPGSILAELRAFYEAFGYDPRVEDPPDHVAVQAGFVGFMKLKQAYAAAQGDAEAEATTREATARFIEAHLADFAGELARRLTPAAPGHLERAAAILDEICPGKRDPLPLVSAENGTDLFCDAG